MPEVVERLLAKKPTSAFRSAVSPRRARKRRSSVWSALRVLMVVVGILGNGIWLCDGKDVVVNVDYENSNEDFPQQCQSPRFATFRRALYYGRKVDLCGAS